MTDMSFNYEEGRALKESLETIVESPAWPYLQQLWTERADALKLALLNASVKTPEQVADFNLQKGRLLEVSQNSEVILAMLEDLKEQLRAYQDMMAASEMETDDAT